jgi:hypothetical protein
MFSIKFILKISESTVLTQMELEKKLNDFHTQLNQLKDKSILKKSMKERKEIYLELKRLEEEKRRKEQEEKEKKMNS